MKKNKLDNLKPFKPGPDERRHMKGRPRKLVTLMAELGYKSCEVNDTLMTLLALSVDELKEVFEDHNATALEKAASAAIRKAIEKGSLYNIETLLTRALGKPKETVDQHITGNLSTKVTVTVKDTGSPLPTSEEEASNL